MNKDTRILFTDLDGTLLNDEKEITPGNQAAINEALAAGHKIVVTTGRALSSGLLIAERAGLTREGCYVITFNGGLIYEPARDEIIYENTMPMEPAKDIFRMALEKGLHIQTYSNTRVLALEETDDLKRYAQIVEMDYEIFSNIDEALEKEPCKVLCLNYHVPFAMADFKKEVDAKYSDVVDTFFSSEYLLEIVPKGTSKGNAVRWLCDHLEIPIENSVAAGDAPNDIEMLKAVHVGAVMKNAYPGVREYGNYVTENDNNHDGLAEIVRKWILK